MHDANDSTWLSPDGKRRTSTSPPGEKQKHDPRKHNDSPIRLQSADPKAKTDETDQKAESPQRAETGR
jgi:hypothetical protein